MQKVEKTQSELPQTFGTYTSVGTNLFATHGLKHFLQLDTELLNVVEDDAGLWKENK